MSSSAVHRIPFLWNKVFFGGMSVAMIYLVIVTSLQSDMFNLPEQVVNEPWFRTTLWDFYFNIAILSAWAVYKEKNRLVAGLWVVAFCALGSIATCFYVLLQFLRLKPGDGIDKVILKG